MAARGACGRTVWVVSGPARTTRAGGNAGAARQGAQTGRPFRRYGGPAAGFRHLQSGPAGRPGCWSWLWRAAPRGCCCCPACTRSRRSWRCRPAPAQSSGGSVGRWPPETAPRGRGHRGRRTGRQPATRGARRASRSLHLAALAAPCSPYSSPRSSPTPRAFPAPAGCSWVPKRLPGPASGLPAGCLPLQCCLLLELCLSVRTVCSAPAAAGASLFGPLSVLQLLGVFGGAGGAVHGIGREQKRSWWSRFE